MEHYCRFHIRLVTKELKSIFHDFRERVHPNFLEKLQVIKILQNGGVIVMPTDTVYSFASMLGNRKGFDRIARIRGIRSNKAHFSILCKDLSDLSHYTSPVANEVFKLMKRALPGPFTFIRKCSCSY